MLPQNSAPAPRRYMFYLAIAHHMLTALLVALDPAAMNVSSVSILKNIFGGSVGVVAVLFAVSVLAIAALLIRAHWALFLVLPQQMLLIITAYGAVQVITSGMYADGVPRPQAFIAADQSIYLWIVIMHSIVLLDAFGALDAAIEALKKRTARWTLAQHQR